MAKSKYVMYVDDDQDDRELLEETFENFNDYQLKTFPNGFELLDALKNKDSRNTPCLIVLDINMPKMSGIEVLNILKTNESLKKIPVVMFTTGAMPYNREIIKEFDTEVVGKPVNVSGYYEISKSLLNYCG
ncbi:MAG: response regulator [Flavisolibacter sp.]